VLLEGDAAGVRARRVLAKLVAEEQRPADPSKVNDAPTTGPIADEAPEALTAVDKQGFDDVAATLL
jgi:hypothetical protein